MKNYRNNPLISVLVPVYNCADFLDDCITSIVSQDYRPFQLILANDGSTDGSLEICRRYASKYDFIEVLTGPNQGVASTRNKLLDNAIGEYLLFVDADDWIEPGTLSCLYEIISSKNSDIAVCAPKRANSDFKSVVDVWGKEKTIKEFLKHKKISGALWNKLIRRSLIEGERFRKDIFYGEDALFEWKI